MGEDPVASLNGIRKRDTSDNRRPAESIPDAVLGGHDESVAEAVRRYGLQARTETHRPGVVIRRILPKSARIPLCIVWRKSAQNPALTAFLEILRTAIPAIRNQMEL
jgi:DNA-binding transcriptional LysR family regulator